MKNLLLSLTFLMSITSAFAGDHPLYMVGKKDYVQKIETTTSLADFRDENKKTIVQFSADWCGPCLKFWPYLYTLKQMKQDAYKVVVVDLSAGWGDQVQFENEGGFEVSGIPFMAVLKPGKKGDKIEVEFSGNSNAVLGNNLLKEQNISEADFMAEVTPTWNNVLMPAYKAYKAAESQAIAEGKSKAEAKAAGAKAALAVK